MTWSIPSVAADKTGDEEANGPDPMRLVVARFLGRAATIPRAGVVQALENEPSVDLLSVHLLEQADAASDGSAESDQLAAKRLRVRAILRGRVSDIPGGHQLVLTIIDGETGNPLEELIHESSTLKSMQEELTKTLWVRLARVLVEPASPRDAGALSGQPSAHDGQPGPRPETSAREALGAEPMSTAGRSRATRPLLQLTAGGGALIRDYTYINRRRGPLRGYRLTPVPIASVGAEVYPWALARSRTARPLLLSLQYAHAVGATSRLGDRELDTLAFHGIANIGYQFAFGVLSMTPALGYDIRVFSVEGGLLPDVAFQSGHLSLALRLELGALFFRASGLGKRPIGTGQIGRDPWFPSLTGFGYELSGGLGVRVTRWLDVAASMGIEHYYFKVGAAASTAVGVADAVTDQYADAGVSVTFYLPPR